MKPKKAKREGPLSVPLPFDEAIRRAVKVPPPKGGWRTLDKANRAKAPKRTRKRPEASE